MLPPKVMGIDVLYHTLLVAPSSVDHETRADDVVMVFALIPESTGGVVSGCGPVINEDWPDMLVFPAASDDSTT